MSSKSLLFIFLLGETEVAQNKSVFIFVWKTSNDSCGRPNLRNGMNQVTNLDSLGFTWKKGNYRESPQVFDPHISEIVLFLVDVVGKLVFVSVAIEADDSDAPIL